MPDVTPPPRASRSGGIAISTGTVHRRTMGQRRTPAPDRAVPVRAGILAATAGAVTAAAVSGGLATDPSSRWYRDLEKPTWQPPPSAFGPVWTALYADLAVTAARTLTGLAGEDRAGERAAFVRALAANLVLNAGWSWTFFRAHRPWWAAAESALLTVSSVDLVRRTRRVSRPAGLALAAYPAWCAFATALTVAVARRNSR